MPTGTAHLAATAPDDCLNNRGKKHDPLKSPPPHNTFRFYRTDWHPPPLSESTRWCLVDSFSPFSSSVQDMQTEIRWHNHKVKHQTRAQGALVPGTHMDTFMPEHGVCDGQSVIRTEHHSRSDQGAILHDHAPSGLTVTANVSIEVTQEYKETPTRSTGYEHSPLRPQIGWICWTTVWAIGTNNS